MKSIEPLLAHGIHAIEWIIRKDGHILGMGAFHTQKVVQNRIRLGIIWLYGQQMNLWFENLCLVPAIDVKCFRMHNWKHFTAERSYSGLSNDSTFIHACFVSFALRCSQFWAILSFNLVHTDLCRWMEYD